MNASISMYVSDETMSRYFLNIEMLVIILTVYSILVCTAVHKRWRCVSCIVYACVCPVHLKMDTAQNQVMWLSLAILHRLNGSSGWTSTHLSTSLNY